MCQICGCGRPQDMHVQQDGKGVIQNMEKVQGEPLNNRVTKGSQPNPRRGKPGKVS